MANSPSRDLALRRQPIPIALALGLLIGAAFGSAAGEDSFLPRPAASDEAVIYVYMPQGFFNGPSCRKLMLDEQAHKGPDHGHRVILVTEPARHKLQCRVTRWPFADMVTGLAILDLAPGTQTFVRVAATTRYGTTVEAAAALTEGFAMDQPERATALVELRDTITLDEARRMVDEASETGD